MNKPARAEWVAHPQSEAFLSQVLGEAMARAPDAARYATALKAGCGVRLRDILDHVAFVDAGLKRSLADQGWASLGDGVWRHALGYFPDFLEADRFGVAFRCERLDAFLAANRIDAKIEGEAHGPYRRADVFTGDGVAFVAVERNGHAGYAMPAPAARTIRQARLHQQSFRARLREFSDPLAGFDHTDALVRAAVDDLGRHWTCDLFMRAEREFWMNRCTPGRLQKGRQDRSGIGWSNIDHHTYDSSRELFGRTIRVLEALGFECRELFYAGHQAGWGSQVLEQPVLRSTIFADIDLAPEEIDLDFAHTPLRPLDKLRRAGIWSVMHGESMLEGGLNHVAGMYDQAVLRRQLDEEGVSMMQPFSDFPHLYQELTEGEWRAVDPRRVDALERAGHLSPEEAEDFRLNGAIATHLENLERNGGYKGFNQPGIDGVLRIIDPRKNMVGSGAPAGAPS